MKILRSVVNRGARVQSAGYFSVVEPHTWFAATRFPDRFPRLRERAEAAAEGQTPGAGHPTTVHLELEPAPEPLRLLRSALILLAAVGITVFAFWWVFVRPHAAYFVTR